MSSDLKPAPLLVNYRDAAAMLGICEKTVSDLVKKGRLTQVKIGDGRRGVRFSVKQLEKFIEDQINPPAADILDTANNDLTKLLGGAS